MNYVRYNRLIFFYSLFITILLCGCSADPFYSIKDQDRLKSSDSSLNAEIVNENDLKPLLTVPGKVIDLEPSNQDSYLVTVWENSEMIPQTSDDLPVRVSLWNLEHSVPFLENSDELESIDSILSTVWNQDENRLFIADKDSRRPCNLEGFRKANVRSLTLNSSLNDQIALLSEENDDQNLRLSPNAYWIACEDRNHVWRLVKRTDQRLVHFPEIVVDSVQGSQKYVVSDILAFSEKNDLVATMISVKEENYSEKAYSDEKGLDKQKSQGRSFAADSFQEKRSESEKDISYSDDSLLMDQYDLIVVWDLQVVDQIEWQNDREPLKAIEVSRFNVQKGIDSSQCAFSPNGTMFAVRSKSKFIGIWGSASGRLLMELGEHQQPIHSMKFDSTNHYLVVGTGEDSARLVLWDIRQGKPLRIYQEPDPKIKQITAVAFSKNGKKIYFGTENGFVKIWNLQK